MTATEAAPANLSRNTTLMAVGTALSRLTGFGRVFALGYALNYTRFTDTYNLANNAPNIVYELVLGGILAATLVPIFVRQFTSETEEEAWRSVGAVLTATCAVLVALTVALFLGAPWIIHLYTLGNHTDSLHDQRQVATFLLRLFAPQVAFYGFISVATGLLHSRRRFAPPMFAPIFNNLVVIFILLALPHVARDLSLSAMLHDRAALTFLGLGTTAGVLAMAIALVPYVRSTAAGKLHWVWQPGHPAVKTALRMSGWTVGFVIANQISLWIMLVLANGHTGSVSAFLAAYTFFILPHGIFTVSVISALAPELAERWARNDVDGFRAQIVRGIRLVTFVIVPAAIGYALLAHPIVHVILRHGHFDASSAKTTADVLFWMVIGLPGFSAFVFLTRAFQSMQDARTVFYLYVVENGINVVTALALYPSTGVRGLAASQSLAYAVAAIVALLVLRQRTHGLRGGQLVSALVRMISAAAVMGVVVYVVREVSGDNALVVVVASIIAGAVVYLGTARLLRLNDVNVFLRRGR